MTCADCVRRIEEALRETAGVHKAAVNFASEKALIEYHDDVTDPQALQDKVHDLGYEAFLDTELADSGESKTTVSIGGMTCAACVRRVETPLRKFLVCRMSVSIWRQHGRRSLICLTGLAWRR
jgi:Cu+-exporting ATPase